MHAKSMAVATFLALTTAVSGATTVLAADQLKINDVKQGTGPMARSGETVTVNYTGWLYQNGTKGAKFDSSFDHGQPFSFKLGAGNVIPGWDKGVVGMKVGGERTLIIPPDLGYGASGTPGGPIPPNATLMFDVQLVKVGS